MGGDEPEEGESSVSTKSTIAHRSRASEDVHDCVYCKSTHVRKGAPDAFHFYTDVFEADAVYLEIESERRRQEIRIPIDIYRVMVEAAPRVEEEILRTEGWKAEERAEIEQMRKDGKLSSEPE